MFECFSLKIRTLLYVTLIQLSEEINIKRILLSSPWTLWRSPRCSSGGLHRNGKGVFQPQAAPLLTRWVTGNSDSTSVRVTPWTLQKRARAFFSAWSLLMPSWINAGHTFWQMCLSRSVVSVSEQPIRRDTVLMSPTDGDGDRDHLVKGVSARFLSSHFFFPRWNK